MKIRNEDQSPFDLGGAKAPYLWYGEGVPTNTERFLKAPLMSQYWNVTSGSEAIYVKTGATGATTDWVKIMYAGASITTLNLTGDLTVSGTLTAGDVIATNA